MRPPLKVVVDECVGLESRLFEEFRAWLGDRAAEFLYLSEAHPGIPDVEILDKLLGPAVVLLTNDCVLHNRACASQLRSFTLNEQQQLTRRPLKDVRTPRRRSAPSVLKQLEPSYVSAPHEIAQRLMLNLPEKRLKALRTVRRRIRSYFGSSANIARVALTVGARRSRGRVLCGFALRIAGHAGVRGLAASEGYCTIPLGTYSDAYCVIHGLYAVFCLHLNHTPIDIYIMPGEVLDLCRSTLDRVPTPVAVPNAVTLQIMLGALREAHLFPCVKGRFHDAMSWKLKQLESVSSNEVRNIDFDDIARRVVSLDLVT